MLNQSLDSKPKILFCDEETFEKAVKVVASCNYINNIVTVGCKKNNVLDLSGLMEDDGKGSYFVYYFYSHYKENKRDIICSIITKYLHNY